MKIELRPASLADRRQVYEWLAKSDATPEMMGPPDFADHPVPEYDEFCADYDDEAFAPEGDFRIFIIAVNGTETGVVHYWINGRVAELDIWIGDRNYWCSGAGSSALNQVAEMLRSENRVDALVIRPSARNPRAVAAYKKAGFEDYSPAEHRLPRWCLEEGFDYEDAVVLARRL